MGSKWVKVGLNGDKWTKMGSTWGRMGSKWGKMDKNVSKCVKIGKNWV